MLKMLRPCFTACLEPAQCPQSTLNNMCTHHDHVLLQTAPKTRVESYRPGSANHTLRCIQKDNRECLHCARRGTRIGEDGRPKSIELRHCQLAIIDHSTTHHCRAQRNCRYRQTSPCLIPLPSRPYNPNPSRQHGDAAQHLQRRLCGER